MVRMIKKVGDRELAWVMCWCEPGEIFDRAVLFRSAQFLAVTCLKLHPLCRVMAEPSAERRAGSHFLSPCIEARLLLRASPRPYPVDQNPNPIARAWCFVDPFDSNHDCTATSRARLLFDAYGKTD